MAAMGSWTIQSCFPTINPRKMVNGPGTAPSMISFIHRPAGWADGQGVLNCGRLCPMKTVEGEELRVDPDSEAGGDLDELDESFPDESGSDMRLALRVGFWVAIMAVLAFLPAIGCDFVNMDDLANFQSNEALKYPLGKKLVWAWTVRWAGVYQPLAWILIFFEYAAWALRPFGYHAVSLALHGMIGVALFVVTRMLLERTLAGTAEQKEPLVVVAAGLAACFFVSIL